MRDPHIDIDGSNVNIVDNASVSLELVRRQNTTKNQSVKYVQREQTQQALLEKRKILLN